MNNDLDKRFYYCSDEESSPFSMKSDPVDYAIDLQRIIESICNGSDLPEPLTNARFHYDMAKKYKQANS